MQVKSGLLMQAVSVDLLSLFWPTLIHWAGDDVDGALVSTVECCVGIISACLPTYRLLINRLRHGHANLRSVNWPSRKKGSENQTIALVKSSRASGTGWTSIPGSTNGEHEHSLNTLDARPPATALHA